MPATKEQFLAILQERFGKPLKLQDSQSLFELADGSVRIYVRYSKVHEGGRTFYGLRKTDLRELANHNSFICFLWDDQDEPLLLPYASYQDVFDSMQPADDGQYKVQVYCRETTELYIARVGRFNVDADFGWAGLQGVAGIAKATDIPDLSHSQVQSLLGAIGSLKGYDVWIPQGDRERLDYKIAVPFRCRDRLPSGYERVSDVLQQIDVVWIQRGGNRLGALYEVEHSTTIYSGLLRLNDVRLVSPSIDTLTIVADEERRAAFSKQVNRPTFQASGLSEVCAFLEYRNVYQWHQRMQGAMGGLE